MVDSEKNIHTAPQPHASLITFTLLAIGYFIAGKLGLRLAFVQASATAVWPPTGIALAALLMLGYRAWPAVCVGAFLVNLTTAGSVATSLGIAFGNTAEALAGAYLVNRFANGRQAFERAQDIFKFTVLAGLVSTAVSATIGVISLSLGGFSHWANARTIWLTWWFGDAGGNLIVAPLLILWKTSRVSWTRLRFLEFLFFLLSLWLVGQIIFGGYFSSFNTSYPLDVICMPLLIWAAFRFSRREAAATSFALSAIAVWGTLHGFGPFVKYSPNESLMLVQAYMGVISVTTLVLAAVVSERTRAEERFRLAVDSAPNAMIMVNQQGSIVLVNAQTEQLFGYCRAELIGRPIEILVPERFRPHHPELRKNFFIHPTARAMGKARELYGLRKDGSELPVEIGLNPIQTERGAFVLSAIIDITERKRAEESLRKAHDQLEVRVAERTASLAKAVGDLLTEAAERKRSEGERDRIFSELQESHEELKAAHLQVMRAAKLESVGQLAAGVAHEVKNPLAIILQGIEYLAKHINRDDEKAVMVLTHTIGAVKRADGIVRGLLDFSSAKELAMNGESLNAVVEQALLLVKHEMDRSSLKVIKELAPHLPRVRMDRNKIEQVFVNVFLNAMQAMTNGGTLTVRTFMHQLTKLSQEYKVGMRAEDCFKIGETIVVTEVEDTGSGIPEKLMQKVFDPFFTTKASGKGTGLGLAVVKKIVELHRGFIAISNRPAGGVKVAIILRADDKYNDKQD